jgi:hypothetical protein
VTPATSYSFQITPDPFFQGLFHTNIVSISNVNLPVPSGGFLIDTNQTGFLFTPIAKTNIFLVTNVVVDITNPVTGERTLQEYVYNFTNVVYTVFPFLLQPAPAAVLRGGIDKFTFVRVGDGTIQGNFTSVTNTYRATYFTNNIWRTSTFQRISDRPDILFSAADLGVTGVIPLRASRSANFVNNAVLNSNDNTQGGPGTIFPTVNITFNKVGPAIFNEFPGEVSEATSVLLGANLFIWASFDASPKPPVVYPQDISLEQIEQQVTGNTP